MINSMIEHPGFAIRSYHGQYEYQDPYDPENTRTAFIHSPCVFYRIPETRLWHLLREGFDAEAEAELWAANVAARNDVEELNSYLQSEVPARFNKYLHGDPA